VNEALWNFYSAGAGAGYGLASGSISFGDAENFRINECPLSVLQGESGLLDSVQGTTPVYVLKRVAGEGRDMPRSMYNHADTQEDKVRSYLEPDTTEREILQYLNDNYDNTVLIINSNAALELDWLADYPNIKSVLYAPTIGAAMADVLTGKVSPSGRTVDTFAADASASPAAQNFGDYAYYDENGSITKYNYVTYEEGIYVGYRYYETAGVPVRFPFGYGLSYSTFTYSAITATATGVDFVVTNDSDVAGSTVAQLYVRAPQGGVLHPDRELKGFVKVELAAHESKSVHIDFDRYTFRHFDVAANAWKTESGEWTLLVGDNAEHLPLAIPHTVAGDCTTADCAADPALGHYLTGQVKDVTDAEMAVLFGHEVLAPGKPTTFGVNDPIMSWVDSKGFAARTVARTLTKREAKIRQKTGSPDLNTLFILNMPPRAMSKMTQGMVDSAMVDAIVNIANGHTFRGLGGVIAGFFRNQSANKRTAKELNHD
jgi:beta-glucosidase